MKDIKAAAAEIQNSISDHDAFPAGFLNAYDPIERLSGSHGTETFLVQQKDGSALYVAKCYDRALYPSVQEGGILQSLRHGGLPAFADEFQNDSMTCVLREYIAGTPLDRYRAENRLTKGDVLAIGIQLCDILTYLHRQQPPVIHRDIKPQNIILKPDGSLALIDFDGSRRYHADATTDTQLIGTRAYAPPEQYGFSQTDCRADLYAAGVLLGWLLTGETDPNKAAARMPDRRLAAIYQKCTAFSPHARFASAEKLKSALRRADGRRDRALLRGAAALLACFLLLFLGFSIGRYTDFLTAVSAPHAGVVFEEPMIERAVRLQLGKAEGEPISEEELLSVTGLFLFGDSLVAASEDELRDAAQLLFENNQMREGPVRSINDLAKMPNLKHICLSMQRITDLTPLLHLPNLESVDVKNNPVPDIAPLGELKFLKRAVLFDTRVTDLSPLVRCPMLTELDAGKLPLESPAAFSGLEGLRNLSLYQTTIATLTGIEQFQQLEFFEMEGVLDGDLTPLLSLPRLKNVVLGQGMQPQAETLTGKAFEVAYR